MMRVSKGAIMLEALLAVGIAAVFMASMIALVLMANATGDRALETQKALWATQEGIDALQTIDWDGLAITSTGSLAFANNRWTLSTTGGPQTLVDGSTRTVRVLDVQRDASCLVVASGGTNDADSRTLESEVTWTDNRGTPHTVTQRTLRTRWDNPTGDCFAANEAGRVDFDFASAEYYGGKQLREIDMTNTGGAAVTIDKISLSWSNAYTIDQLFIDNSKVWSAGGPGTPTGSQTAPIILDIANFVIAPGATVELNKGQFSGTMNGASIIIEVIFVDGSSFSSGTIYPS